MNNLVLYIVAVLVCAESRSVLILTNNLNRLPSIHQFLTTYDFEIDGKSIQVQNVITTQDID